ncbi:hypothetical protein [Chryseobacterium potabilaquae]|uniref:Uncharacterized protein n=1 Tax=Chryseobacterium potabilaquae TaxID=2675057 RepID=A0A6N4XAJ6_9FLAO|nr:hypothetical protein [Chryseobacterium potabilaquae]CAA7196732.1 hypothetical protein CHRY9293_02807 [Chryseobacterium potabilaquae]
MNTNQRLELIEREGKIASVLKDELMVIQNNAIAEGYLLTYLYSDNVFVYMLFSKFTLPTA